MRSKLKRAFDRLFPEERDNLDFFRGLLFATGCSVILWSIVILAFVL